MKPGDLYLGQFPFGDTPGMKLRPVLVLSAVTGPSAEVLVSYVSSVIPADLLPTDVMSRLPARGCPCHGAGVENRA
jgi:hypothetical protein